VQYGFHGRAGPIMTLDALSESDGVLTFRGWGPVRGSSGGLVLNQDPIISLFKSGYRPLIINNHPGRDHRARVRGFNQYGGTVFRLEVFRGTPDGWLAELEKLSFEFVPKNDETSLKFREPFLNRLRQVSAEREKVGPLSPRNRAGRFFRYVDEELRFLEDGRR
jgi:hypothetical protein